MSAGFMLVSGRNAPLARLSQKMRTPLLLIFILLLLSGLALPAVTFIDLPGRPGQADTAGQPATVQTLADLPTPAQAAISAAIGRDRATYHTAVRDDGSLTLTNPAQKLDAVFSADAATVRTRELAWNLLLRAWGFGNQLQAAARVAPRATENRVEYARGALTEWYVNGPQGVQQGFTIHAPPPALQAPPDTLTLALALDPGLQAQLSADKRGLTLSGAEGTTLRYSGLTAFDAAGRELAAWLELPSPARRGAGGEVRLPSPARRGAGGEVYLPSPARRGAGGEVHIRVSVAGAQYPITVDPFVEQGRLIASDRQSYDLFGWSVAISGDVVVVGAFQADPGSVGDAGAAYVFEKPGGGWADMTHTAKLTASDKAWSDQFGYSVGISGDVVVVGAPYADPDGASEAGAAYVFVKPGIWTGTLTESAKLTASDKVTDDFFGYSVAISGDTLVVGALYAAPGGV
ncbi:MAG: FG-GAP repeat protein, partial [Anaerolineae bacterium]